MHFDRRRGEGDCGWVGGRDQWSVMEPSRCLPLELHAGMISVGVCLCMCVTELMEGHQAWGDQRGEKMRFIWNSFAYFMRRLEAWQLGLSLTDDRKRE